MPEFCPPPSPQSAPEADSPPPASQSLPQARGLVARPRSESGPTRTRGVPVPTSAISALSVLRISAFGLNASERQAFADKTAGYSPDQRTVVSNTGMKEVREYVRRLLNPGA